MSQDAGTHHIPRPTFLQEFVPKVAPTGSFWIRASDSALFYYSGDITRGINGWVRIFENIVPVTGFSGNLTRHRVVWEDPELVDYQSVETYETGLLKTVAAETRAVITSTVECTTTTTTTTITTTTTTTPTTTTTTPTTTTTTTTGLSPVAGSVLWLKDAGLVGFSDGQGIDVWEDSAGSNDAEQVTVGERPTYQTNQLNSYPVVRFDGVDNSLVGPLTLAQPMTVFVVSKRTAAIGAPDGSFLFDGDDATDRVALYITVAAGNPHAYYAGLAVSSATNSDTNFHYLCGVFNGASSHLFLDGVEIAAGNTGAIGLSGYTLGKDANSAANFLTGDIAEVIVYPTALSDGDRGIVEAYLAWKFAL